MSFERNPLQSFPSLSLFRIVRLVSLTFLSHFCFVCEMSGRVWLVFQTSTHVLHPAHVWGSHARTPPNSEKEGPQSEAEHKQDTITTEHDKFFHWFIKNVCSSQNLFRPPPVYNDRKRLLKVYILTKSLVFSI